MVIDIFAHLLISLLIAVFFWPYLGPFGLISVLIAAGWLTDAWMRADRKVAAKAGFRPPTPVQQRYLEHLGIVDGVFTHPSLLPIAGSLASSRRRLILLTAGVFKMYSRHDLSEKDLRRLLTKLQARNDLEVGKWTFHLAAGGSFLFSAADKDDPTAQWGRNILLAAAVGGIGVIAAGPSCPERSAWRWAVRSIYRRSSRFFGCRLFIWRRDISGAKATRP
jgi:hypothetical protein